MTEAAEQLPDLLLPYQQRLLENTSAHKVVLVEKSRRTGFTWGVAADAVLTAGKSRAVGGMHVLYMGYEREMTREFIETCGMWAKALNQVCQDVEEFLFYDEEADKHIQAFRINFFSGFRITALCSKPRSLRGKQGFLVLDEAGFHDELLAVVKAAVAFLMWGGKLLIISTHNGVENPFNRLVTEVKAGKLPYKLMTVTLDDALAEGLYERICLSTGKEYSLAAQDEWRHEVISSFPSREEADEELFCIPRNSGGKYLSRVLLESRTSDAPVIEWKMQDDFVDLSDDERAAHCLEWCTENIAPVIATLPSGSRHYLGEDFARSGDLTDLWITALGSDLRRVCMFLVELRNIPFKEQEQVLMYICDRLPRFSGAALDARGNGQYLAERARQKYGGDRITEVMISNRFYAEQWPRFKAALEDDMATIPKNDAVVDDFRTVEVIKGIPTIASHTKTDAGKRHGDSAIAGLLCFYASEQLDVGPIEVSVTGGAQSNQFAPEYHTVAESEFYQ